ncbi:MAG: 25S rRNA (adenine645-N1)-methyltransferase [Trizodia sp. TS-e1964]|nr:MAG: 25S rRNA (adenine645-N1)-methyltransferase [Trizodia sp. TS-e1964]
MFAVPGWSIAPSSLKPQTESLPATSKPSTGSGETPADLPLKDSRRRKRSHGQPAGNKVVTTENLTELWEKVIEGKPAAKRSGAFEKRERKRRRTEASALESIKPVDDGHPTKSSKEEFEKRKKSQEMQREKKIQLQASGELPPKRSSALTQAATKPSLERPSAPTPELTPLQISMRQKLTSARFRHINQTLYTTPSDSSLQLFAQNPDIFKDYHEGFQRQVELWPENPVQGYIRDIKERGALRIRVGSKDKKPKAASKEESSPLQGLPRTDGTCKIADLGCGDARLATVLQPFCKKLHLSILSYDLYSTSPLVTVADARALPLADGSIDVVIFCLALMGTNWIDFIEEAFRVLRWKGELWIAEIKSRFGRVTKSTVDHSVGNRKNLAGQSKQAATSTTSKAKQKEQEGQEDEAELMVEVDGNADNKAKTDPTAFVEVLHKRGFTLNPPDPSVAIDLSNKMFIKLQFLKGVTPVKGKSVSKEKKIGADGVPGGGLGRGRPPKPKFLDVEGNDKEIDEAAVLKPCVYKLR